MKNRQWEAIHEIYTRMEKLCGKSLYIPEEPASDLRDGEPSGSKGSGKNGDQQEIHSVDDIVNLRTELRNQLDMLKAVIAEEYSESDTYMILFAITAQIDELIQARFLKILNISWPLLQKELFQIDDAGDIFFEIVDDILSKPQTHVFIYEIYYFCIRYGFRGRYDHNPAKISEYLKKLQAKLPDEGIPIPDREYDDSLKFRRFYSPFWIYLVLAGFLVLAYFCFRIMGK